MAASASNKKARIDAPAGPRSKGVAPKAEGRAENAHPFFDV